jgi:hypothetical protein
MAWLAWRSLRSAANGNRLWSPGGRGRLAAGFVALAVVPVLVGALWTDYADSVRRASAATAWLSAENLKTWNFGSWAQRIDWRNWALIGNRLQATFLPAACLIFPLLGAYRAIRAREAGGAFVLAMAGGALAAIAIFFNLYREHNYYLIAVSPAVAFLAGYGFDGFCFEWAPFKVARWTIVAVALAFWQWNAQPYLRRPFSLSYEDDFVYNVGRAIADVTDPGERILVEGNDWSPDFLYYAQRKGLMWRGSIVEQNAESVARLLASDRFTTIVCLNHRSSTVRFWEERKLVRQVGPVTIYKVRNRAKTG